MLHGLLDGVKYGIGGFDSFALFEELVGGNQKQVESAVMGATMSLIYENASGKVVDNRILAFMHCSLALEEWMSANGTEEDLPFLAGLRERFKRLEGDADVIPKVVLDSFRALSNGKLLSR